LKKYSLSKNKRLSSNKQFKAILADGYSARNGLLILYMSRNDCGYPRLGISVGKIYGNAVTRNRLKRLIREVFRLNQYRIPSDYDYLLMVSYRKGIKNKPTFEQVRKSFLSLTDLILNKHISRGK